jgi:glycosyltransferase involved in cell wall biosynthesis
VLSVVIPIHCDETGILAVYDRLTAVLENLHNPYEIIVIDDTRTDETFHLLENLVETDCRLKVLRLRRTNCGHTVALAAGFDEAQGDVIVSLDSDLKQNPEDILLLLNKLDEGYDIASCWLRDTGTQIPARIANWMMRRALGVELHDFGQTSKAYRAEVLKEVNLYGELHRFIPALAGFYGARIAEVPTRSAYPSNSDRRVDISRMCRTLFDILTIKFLLRYLTRPMHFFGKWGLIGAGLGSVILIWLAISKLAGRDIFAEHGPLLVATALLWLAGLLFFSTGLIGEVLMRTYFESQGRRIYAIREIRCSRNQLTGGTTR